MIIKLIGIVFLNTIGQIFLKSAVVLPKKKIFFLTLGYLSFILVLYLSYELMKVIEIKFFVAILSINYIMILFASKLIFSEEISKRKLVGTLLVILGVIIFIWEK